MSEQGSRPPRTAAKTQKQPKPEKDSQKQERQPKRTRKAPTEMSLPPITPPGRQVFCSRTLNLRGIKAIGYDMDYTLVHYRADVWEGRAYAHAKQHLLSRGLPVESLQFDPELVTRGLVVDTDKGNILKANRFGYVKKAMHGTRPMDFEAQRAAYSREVISLSEKRWVFLNTLFSLSEGCLFAQLVDLFDAGRIACREGYPELFRLVREALDSTHMEGRLKAEIMAAPERFVVPDPEMPLALLDQKHAGKKLMLITNSEWAYTRAMMDAAFTPFLPEGTTWQSLFDVIIVSSRKPGFFLANAPLFEVVDAETSGGEGLLRPCGMGENIEPGRVYWGGSASLVEKEMGVSGEEVLFVGDHMWSDVHASKSALKWRTALILRELERDTAAISGFRASQEALDALMEKKDALEKRHTWLRLSIQRLRHRYGPPAASPKKALEAELETVREQIAALDEKISPLAQASGELGSALWGPLMRAGNDKSLLARQVETYADIYTSRVSNLLYATPFAYLRSENAGGMK
jgi:HAD superfamily (subfamily IG) hydrolase, 5''-nucleotidase